MRWRFELEQCSICDLLGQILLLEIWLCSHKPQKTPIYHLPPGLVVLPPLQQKGKYSCASSRHV
jgi:hypothetical protein